MHELSDSQLRKWASEHLVYEARMLTYAAVELANRESAPPDQRSNVLLESFAIHVRCLSDLLWGKRRKDKPKDAFAFDFCEEGVWVQEVGTERPAALEEIGTRWRVGREVAHLTYHRSVSAPEPKEWPVGDLLNEITDALHDLTLYALPTRMDTPTRTALQDPSDHSKGIGPVSVATGAMIEYTGDGSFPNLHGS